MNTQIKTTGGFSLTPAISEYVEKRVATLSKFVDNDPTAMCTVELGKTTGHHKHGDIFKAEIRVVGKGRDLYVGAEKADLYLAIDQAREEIFRKLTSTKEKRISFVRRGGAKIKNIIKGLIQ
jgi:ribosomal subunit interface protein